MVSTPQSHSEFLCWEHEESERDGGKIHPAMDAQHAAEIHAEESFNGGDPFHSTQVWVEDIHGKQRLYEVTADPSVEFNAAYSDENSEPE